MSDGPNVPPGLQSAASTLDAVGCWPRPSGFIEPWQYETGGNKGHANSFQISCQISVFVSARPSSLSEVSEMTTHRSILPAFTSASPDVKRGIKRHETLRSTSLTPSKWESLAGGDSVGEVITSKE